MKRLDWFLACLVVALVPAIAGCYATVDRVDSLEGRIQSVEEQQDRQAIQQQHSAAEIDKQLASLKGKADGIDQRLSELDETDVRLTGADAEIRNKVSELAETDVILTEADAETRNKVSELESKLDARAIDTVLATPWQYFAIAAAIFFFGTMVGVYGSRLVSRVSPN